MDVPVGFRAHEQLGAFMIRDTKRLILHKIFNKL